MKAITIKQPFATLIAEGLKEYEFRTWKTKYRGDILIHAGKGVDKTAMKRFAYRNLNYPLGCFVAKATITDCVEVDDEMREVLRKKDFDEYPKLPIHEYGQLKQIILKFTKVQQKITAGMDTDLRSKM